MVLGTCPLSNALEPNQKRLFKGHRRCSFHLVFHDQIWACWIRWCNISCSSEVHKRVCVNTYTHIYFPAVGHRGCQNHSSSLPVYKQILEAQNHQVTPGSLLPKVGTPTAFQWLVISQRAYFITFLCFCSCCLGQYHSLKCIPTVQKKNPEHCCGFLYKGHCGLLKNSVLIPKSQCNSEMAALYFI